MTNDFTKKWDSLRRKSIIFSNIELYRPDNYLKKNIIVSYAHDLHLYKKKIWDHQRPLSLGTFLRNVHIHNVQILESFRKFQSVNEKK